VVEHELNGLLVRPAELGDAIQRYFSDPELQARLRAHAAESVRRLAPEEIYPRYEAILEEVAR
jgi:glycosyltransferase involved in cell wall biosynthesis